MRVHQQSAADWREAIARHDCGVGGSIAGRGDSANSPQRIGQWTVWLAVDVIAEERLARFQVREQAGVLVLLEAASPALASMCGEPWPGAGSDSRQLQLSLCAMGYDT